MNRGIGVVSTHYGKVSGVEKDGITVFKSIPYAAPPVGGLRWRAPANPASWEGVRACDTFGDIPWQLPGFVGLKALKMYKQNEDCLYLNIWTPAQSANEKLPVLFWIHGGGFQGGVGHEELYHGWHMASKGVIEVTISYRLGVMGFLAHPELSREDPRGVSGNYGLLDIIKALKWVKQNIAAFGGDPQRITIDGQSAGGAAVCCLMASPQAAGLFSGAVIQSGGPNTGLDKPLEQSEQMGLLLQQSMGCGSIAEMRKAAPSSLVHASLPDSVGRMPYMPNVDGVILPMTPYKAFLTGQISSVPILFGSNSDEGFFAADVKSHADYLQAIKEYFGEDYEEFSSLYSTQEKDFADTKLTAARDLGFANLRYVAQQLERSHPCPVYHYYFCQPTVMDNGNVAGATHSSELFYVFHTLNCLGGSTLDGETWRPVVGHAEQSLSDTMTTYWASFVKNGDPNTVGLPAWPAYDSASDCHMRLVAGDTVAESSRYPERIKFMTRQSEKHVE